MKKIFIRMTTQFLVISILAFGGISLLSHGMGA